ncbi:AAA family ATPase [Enterobacter mori]
MLKKLQLSNVGPAPQMELEFGDRLNLITGDNGLGKSFLLDIAWWSLTRRWPSEINPAMNTGKKILPRSTGDATITFSFSAKKKQEEYTSSFQRREQSWTGRQGRPANPGLVLYAMTDGSFAVWDPARNYWKTKDNVDIQERRPAYVFSPQEVWQGLKAEDGNILCNGIIADLALWQKENGKAISLFNKVLHALSPSEKETLVMGDLARISLDDARDMPTVRMPYGQDVPVIHASSGIRRILALAYFLIWAWQEHQYAADILDEEPTHQIVFLIDEIESHLHPSWQRSIVPAVLNVMKELTSRPDVQLIAATHSPLVMASVEPVFKADKDAWFDLDFIAQNVVLSKRDFIRQGDVSNWLTSEAFDLNMARSLEAEKVLSEAAKILSNDKITPAQALKIDKKLRAVLSDTDPFWMRWRYVGEKKGWL